MKYFIPTYEQAVKMVESNPIMTFYRTIHNVDEYEIHIFNYKLAWFKEFISPVAGEDWTAYEVRGLSFIFNKDGSLFNRHILLNKFWNINQNEDTFLSNLKDKKVKYLSNKLDGSIASFVRLPNGRVIGKSKASFESEQAVEINNLYNTNNKLSKFVDWTLDNNLVAIFEYESPSNKIVLDYTESKLILLKLRDNATGEYVNIYSLDKKLIDGIELAELEPTSTLEDLVELSKTITDKEGWVIQFEDDTFVKQKTDWYFKRHRLLTEQLNRENDVIKLILDDQIDDVVSQLGESEVDIAKKKWIENIQVAVNGYLSTKIESVELKLKLYNDLKENTIIKNGTDKDYRKIFAIKYGKTKDFSIVMNILNGKETFTVVKEYVSKETKDLMKAKKFLKCLQNQ